MLNRVLQATELNTGKSYIDCYADFSRSAAEHGGTVRDVLAAMGVTQLDGIVQDLKTLSQAAQARQRTEERIDRAMELDSRPVPTGRPDDPAGRTPRDGRTPIDDETYAQVMSAEPVHWRRLRQARALPGGEHYQGDTGRDRFRNDDRLHAESGIDLVGDMKRNARRTRADGMAAAATQRLEAALQKGSDPAERRRLLSAAISEGTRQLDQSLGVSAPSGAAGRRPRQGPLSVVTLDDGRAGGRKLLSSAELGVMACTRAANRGSATGIARSSRYRDATCSGCSPPRCCVAPRTARLDARAG